MSDKKPVKRAAKKITEKADGDKPSQLVRWDDSKMSTNFANVVNLQSTREQVDLFFGTNQTWSMKPEEKGPQVQVELSNRVILSPHAAKRLALALNDVLKKYEARYGQLHD